jgi:3-dehydrosphinganine reductase
MTGYREYYNEKLALITGGSSGIGLALAQELAAAGAHVWLLARREEALEAALANLPCEGAGQECGFVRADVSDWKQVEAAVKKIEQEVGTPDLLINSAGETHPGYVQDIPLEIFEKLMAINYLGTVYTTKAMLPGMIARGSGHIVNLSSGAGYLGVFGYTAYGATKYAVRGFSDALRAEMKPLGIRVSIAFPPDTDTPQLAYENEFKPPETRALAGNAGVLSAQAVAQEILRGVARGRYVILPGVEMKLLYRLNGLLGNAVYPLMDWIVRSARRSVTTKK